MKILFLSDLLAYGGASKLIYDLLPRMVAKGHECELLILTDDNSKYVEELRNKGVPVHIVPKDVKGHLGNVRYIKKWIEHGNYNIIHANLFPTIYYCSLVKRILGKKCPPLVMTEHNTDNRRRHKPFLRPVEKFVYKAYDHVISISDKTQENLCNWLGTEGEAKYTVIENGIDLEKFMNSKSIPQNELYETYKEGDILLLTVGRFSVQKNHKKLIEALNLLPAKYKLLLCGEGELEKEIREQVTKLELSDRVVFLGFRKDIADIMRSADILVIPSIWEGFGLIAAEGMACGIPITASDVPGLSEVVGDAGIKFNPNSPADISKAVSHISDSTEMKHRVVKLGLEKAKEYDINRMVERYLKAYSNLLFEKE